MASLDAVLESAGRHTTEVFGEMWITRGVGNLPDVALHPSLTTLEGAFAGKPCIIVAAGPSLTNNVDLLREAQGRSVIICVSHAIGALRAAGVIPNFAILTDSQAIAYHFDGFPVEKLDAIIAGVAVHPDVYRLPAPRFVHLASNPMIDEWAYACLGGYVMLPTGGSVANLATSTARYLGCDPIIFVGQDLSYKDGQCYASTTVDGGTRVKAMGGTSFTFEGWSTGVQNIVRENLPRADPIEHGVALPGYYGGHVMSSQKMALYHAWFENTAKQWRSQVRLLNCTEGGARIDGMEHIPLRDALSQALKESVDVGAKLDAVYASLDRGARLIAMARHIDELLTALDTCGKRAQRCVQLAKQAQRNAARLKQLTAAEQELNAAMPSVRFVSTIRQREIREAVELSQKSKNLVDNLRASLQLYQVMLTAVDLLTTPLQTSRARIQQLLA